jgi:hypothetical protein
LSMPAGSPVKSKFQAIAAQDPPPIFIRAWYNVYGMPVSMGCPFWFYSIIITGEFWRTNSDFIKIFPTRSSHLCQGPVRVSSFIRQMPQQYVWTNPKSNIWGYSK